MSTDPGGNSYWGELISLGFATLAGMFGYTMKRISEVEATLKADQAVETHALREEVARMDKAINDRFQEGRDDRNEMWRTIRGMEAQAAKQHSENIEKVSRLPTRDEMMAMIERLLAGRPGHPNQWGHNQNDGS